MKSQSIYFDTICFTNLSRFTFVFRIFPFDSFMMFNFNDLANLMFIHFIFFNFDYSFYFNLKNFILFLLILLFKIKNIRWPNYSVILFEIGLLKMDLQTIVFLTMPKLITQIQYPFIEILLSIIFKIMTNLMKRMMHKIDSIKQ